MITSLKYYLTLTRVSKKGKTKMGMPYYDNIETIMQGLKKNKIIRSLRHLFQG